MFKYMRKGGGSMNNRNDEKWLQPLKNRPDLEPNPIFAKELKEMLTERQMIKRRNFSWLKMWLPLAMAVMYFAPIITVSYVTSKPGTRKAVSRNQGSDQYSESGF